MTIEDVIKNKVDMTKLTFDERVQIALNHSYDIYNSELSNNPTSIYCKFMKEGNEAIYKHSINLQCCAIGLLLNDKELNAVINQLMKKITGR